MEKSIFVTDIIITYYMEKSFSQIQNFTVTGYRPYLLNIRQTSQFSRNIGSLCTMSLSYLFIELYLCWWCYLFYTSSWVSYDILAGPMSTNHLISLTCLPCNRYLYKSLNINPPISHVGQSWDFAYDENFEFNIYYFRFQTFYLIN